MAPKPEAERDERAAPGPAARLGRKILLWSYVTFTGLIALWTLLSVVQVHAGFHKPKLHFKGPKISPRADKPKELRRCHRDVERLLRELHDQTFALQAKALKYDINPATEWRNWAQAWRMRWSLVDSRCRLRELSGSGTSKEIDALYGVHDALSELQLSYTDVMDRFVERFARRLREQQRRLERVNKQIESRVKRQRDRAASPHGRSEPVATR